MNKMTIMGIWFLSLLINIGCDWDLVEYDSNDLKIYIEKGLYSPRIKKRYNY